MAKISEIMSGDVQVVEPQQSLRIAAQRMRDLDVGALPVCDGERLLGMLTDRDIAVRAVADGLTPDTCCVSDVMTHKVACCTADQDVQEVMRIMTDQRLGRMPVLNAQHRLVGIVSMGALARSQAAASPGRRSAPRPRGAA
jgi:CBS domain-containing protein